jgi:hypothetical protein
MKKTVMAVAIVLSILMILPISAAAAGEYVTAPNLKGHLKVIWGFEENVFTPGMKLGEKASDPNKYVTDSIIGPNTYELTVKAAPGGESGKYGEFICHGKVSDYDYVNPIFDLTKYPGKNVMNDWTGYSEMWCWIDTSGFGDQINATTGKQGLDFAFMLYEQDVKDGKKVDGKFERWAIKTGASYYIQEGSGWKELKSDNLMMSPTPKNFKGWLRIPFASMDCVTILGFGNLTLDLKYVVNITLGIPMNASMIGKTMKIDTMALYSPNNAPAPSASSAASSSTSTSSNKATGGSSSKSTTGSTATGSTITGSNIDNSAVSTSDESGIANVSQDGSATISGNTSSSIDNKSAGKSNNNWIIYLVIAVIVVCGGGIGAYYFLFKKHTKL